VTNIWPVGQSFRGMFVREQVEALRAIGVHVEVELVGQDRPRRDYLTAARRVRARARRERFDIVHAYDGLSGPATRFTAGVPRVMTLLGSDINVRWRRWLTRASWGGAAARIYVSRRLAERSGDRSPDVISSGVDLDLFRPVDRRRARTELGLDPDEPVVMFGGEPEKPVKGFDVFSDVLAELRGRGIEAREQLLAERGRPREAVPLEFAAADVLLFTSRRGAEGSPHVIREAAVMGLPVVSVDVGDVAEVLDGVAPSAVVPFPEPWGGSAARAALIDGLADRAAEVLSSRARSNGRERNASIGLPQLAERLVAVYRRVLAERSAGDRQP
jgi:glycosyltransferase involved in cell wall biosynthesis